MTTLDTMLDECGLADELTDREVALLDATVTGPLEHLVVDAPAPSAALEEAVAERFGTADDGPDTLVIPLAPAMARRRGRRLALGAAAAIVAVVASTGVAAANNKLPAPIQRELAEFSRHHLPFEFPAPQQQEQQKQQQAPPQQHRPRPAQPTLTTDDDQFDDNGGEVDRDDRVEPGDDRDDRDDRGSDNSGPGSDDSGSDNSGSDNSGPGSDDSGGDD